MSTDTSSTCPSSRPVRNRILMGALVSLTLVGATVGGSIAAGAQVAETTTGENTDMSTGAPESFAFSIDIDDIESAIASQEVVTQLLEGREIGEDGATLEGEVASAIRSRVSGIVDDVLVELGVSRDDVETAVDVVAHDRVDQAETSGNLTGEQAAAAHDAVDTNDWTEFAQEHGTDIVDAVIEEKAADGTLNETQVDRINEIRDRVRSRLEDRTAGQN